MKYPQRIIALDEDGNATISILYKEVKLKNGNSYPVYRFDYLYHSLDDFCRDEFGDDVEGIEEIK